MRLQDHQKRMALQSMTDEDTPFRPTRTQTIFKNAANVSLRGSTYDAAHLDKFLSSGYGERSINGAPVGYTSLAHETVSAGRAGPGGGGGSNMMSYLMSGTSSTIKPSYSFMTMGRNDYKQDKYVDLQDGPSAMQILGNEKTLRDRSEGNKTFYEAERENHLDKI